MLAPRKQRTRQHVIADLSVHHVERFILEEGHTAQRLSSDYGYDLLRSEIMKRTDVTYGRLGEVLRSLGFTCRKIEAEPPALRYEHEQTGALISEPPYPESDFVYAHHLLAARTILDLYGIADPAAFATKLKKTG